MRAIKPLLIFICISLIYTSNLLFAQKDYSNIKELHSFANVLFQEEDYTNALEKYIKLLKTESDNKLYNYRAGICYIKTNIDKKAAIPYFQQVLKNEDFAPITFYYLGQAYMHNYQFYDAIGIFNQYKDTKKPDPSLVKEINHLIDMAYSSIDIMLSPINVSFENLGETINSEEDDFNPFVSKDESLLVFSTSRDYNREFLYYEKNVYKSFANSSQNWGVSKKLKINTEESETTAGLTPDGEHLFVIANSMDYYNDILMANRSKKRFAYNTEELVSFIQINSKGNNRGASMTEEGIVFFGSERAEDSQFSEDIYMVKKLPSGEWAVPQNIGDIINTSFDECYPNISADGKTLHFASNGHNSIGGFDVFKSEWDEATRSWSDPENIGFPINTTDDNFTISYAGNNRHAYISSSRKKSYGGLDIYRVTFNDTEKQLTVLVGNLLEGNKEAPLEYSGITKTTTVSIYDEYDNLYGMYVPTKKNKRFVAALPEGQYTIKIRNKGYKTLEESFSIASKNGYKKETTRSFYISQ